MLKLTPLLILSALEPDLPFWQALGYVKTAEVPEGDHLGFVILQKDKLEIMLQTQGALKEDLPATAKSGAPAMLFIEVASLAEVAPAVKLAKQVIAERRKTFYGSTETVVMTPGGTVVIFAEFEKKGE